MKTRAASVLCLVVSCGGASAPPSEPPRSPHPVASADVPPPRRPGRLWRRDVTAVLSEGLGVFLRRLQVEPFAPGGKFRGWRIVKLDPNDPLWAGVDLAPGDIVTAVNGRKIERPEEALTAFQSLAVASELRVAYERDGARRELVYPIDDEPPR